MMPLETNDWAVASVFFSVLAFVSFLCWLAHRENMKP